MPDPSYSSLIFPLASQPSPLTSLKRSPLTIHNRLSSIASDAEFVTSAARSKRLRGRPLVANERCGSWYVPPREKGGSAYFKSTDGHERAWKFSTRRLNLHLLDTIEENDGIIIVDSTRRGKRMPDALSTTIPIWCTVLNLTLLPSHPLSSTLHLPPSALPTIHAQISALIPGFVASFKALNLPLEKYRLAKPLRPFWVTRDSNLESDDEKEEETDEGKAVIFEEYRPVVCCTASRRVVGSEVDEGGYIQGAGDDTENWAHGLTPPVFWAHAEELLIAAEADLPELIINLVKTHADEEKTKTHEWREIVNGIAVQQLPFACEKEEVSDEVLCRIALTSSVTPKDSWVKSNKTMEVGLGKSKAASRNLRAALPDICSFINDHLSKSPRADSAGSGELPGTIVLACDSGKDISIGAALGVWCWLLEEDGTVRLETGETPHFTKDIIKARLGVIMTKYPDVNPNRATLQSVNSFLMDWR